MFFGTIHPEPASLSLSLSLSFHRLHSAILFLSNDFLRWSAVDHRGYPVPFGRWVPLPVLCAQRRPEPQHRAASDWTKIAVVKHLAIFINMWSNVDQAPLKSKTEQQTQLLQAAQVCLAWWFQTQRTGLPVFASFFRFMPAEGLWNKPGWCNTLDLLVGAPHWKILKVNLDHHESSSHLLGWTSHIWNHQHLKFEIDDGDQTRHCGVECFRMEQRQSQSLESVAQNVRVRNPIGQSQSPLNTSTGCRETMNGRKKVSNKESVTPWKPGGGSRNPEENRKSTTKSQSPLKAGKRIKESWEKAKSTRNSPSRNP